MALTYNCYVRLYAICDENGTIIQNNGDSYAGHFDLQINKPSGDTLGLAYSENVFSYVPRGSNDKGTLRVFNANNTASVFSTKTFRLYKWHFTATEAQVRNFKNKLATCIGSKNTASGYTWYDVTDDAFDYYDIASANCFMATAVFTNWMGKSNLMSVYNTYKDQTNGYKQYFAWRMLNNSNFTWTGGTVHNA